MGKQSKGVFLTPEGSVRKSQTPHVNALCILLLTLLVVGLFNLYSASQGTHYFFSQLRNLMLIIPAFILFGWFIPIKQVNENGYYILAVICFLLMVVLLLGRIAGGAQRWLSLGPIGFQPSEFAKLATAITVAKFFSTNRLNNAYRLRDLLPLIAMIGLVFSLIFAQPDFGTAGICLLIALVQISFIKINLKSLGLIVLSSPIVGAFGWLVLLKDYQKLRILNLLNPNLDPQNSGYNSLQSLIAIGSGSLFGKGYMKGTQTQLKFLPERHTDFVFSVFAEEQGFWGCAFVFSIFTVLTYIALDISRQAKDPFNSLLAIGIAAFLFLEFTINIAMVLGIFPVVGLPLPFFSYGTSLLLTICVGQGLLVSINRTSSGRSR